MRLIQVAVPVPQLDALTYAVPAEFPDPVPGARVLVPLGKRTLTGVVVGVITESRVAIRDSRFEEFQDNESQPDVSDVQAAKDEPRTDAEPRTATRDPRLDQGDHRYPRRFRVPAARRRQPDRVGVGLLRVRGGGGDGGRDAAARVDRERAARADYGRRPRAAADGTRRAAPDPRRARRGQARSGGIDRWQGRR